MSPRNARFKREGGSPLSGSSAFLTNLGCREGLSGLIIATVSINNIEGRIVIDTGASASFLPKEGIVVKGSNPILLPTYTDTRIADNGQLDCTHVTYGSVVLTASNTTRSEAKFLIINAASHILGYDGLIGTDLIKSFGISIGLEENSLVAKIEATIIGKEDSIFQCEAQLGVVLEQQESLTTPLDKLLKQYSSTFAESVDEPMKTKPMKIELNNDEMPKARLRRYSVEDTAEIDLQVKSMLKRDVIEPSVSPYSSNCHLVPKKNGQKRLVINFIPLNRIAVKDHYPLPQISDLLAHLTKAKYFCALDCTEGFWQIEVSVQDRPKTAFITPQGLYQFRRCPFGFTNSPAVFQRAMNEVFRDALYSKCVIYIDDILVYGRTKDETLENLEWVLEKCKQNGIKLKLSKCEFIKEEVNFLGYRVGQGTISPIPDKHISWKDSEPNTVKEAQAFLGFINYYSRFLENFSERTNPMRQAIKTQPFVWTKECEVSKQNLLKDLNSSTSQVIPMADTPKQVCIMVFDNSIEATCLTSEGQLIMRTSAILSSTQKNYSSLEKELLALVRAYNKFGPILRGPVIVKTSCLMLPNILKLKEKPDRVARLLLQLPPEAEFEVKAINHINDALQRMSEPPEEVFYTDGASGVKSEDSNLASWAVIGVNHPEFSSSGILEDSTNQKAELEAVIKACEIARKNGLKRILIATDSKYVTSACEKWIDRWEENGWLDNRNKPVKNEEVFKRLIQVKKDLELKLVHVRGHSGDKYNELADKMAREALLQRVNACASIHSPPELQQNSDKELNAIKQKLREGTEVKNYFLKGETLWSRQLDGEKLVVPKCQRPMLLNLAHNDPIYGAHYGIKKTRRKLEHYYWYGMGTDIANFVSGCEVCQRYKSSKQKLYGKLAPIKTSAIFNRVHLDIVGPVTATLRNNKFIVTGIDAFSRLGFARAYPSVTAAEIISTFKEEVLYRHGPPANIVTDNGTQFKSILFQNFVKDLDIKHSTTCEYNPQSNGMDERFNGTLVTRLKNLVDKNHSEWDLVLQSAVLAYNLTSNDSSGLTPYAIVYGRLPRSPLNPVDLEIERDTSDHQVIRDEAAENTLCSQNRAAVQYDKNRQDFNLEPLDLVMVKTTGGRDSRKFAPRFTGPHCILRLLEHDGKEMACEILDSDTFKIRRIPFGAIKRYHSPPAEEQFNLPGNIILASMRDENRAGNVNSILRSDNLSILPSTYLAIEGQRRESDLSPICGVEVDCQINQSHAAVKECFEGTGREIASECRENTRRLSDDYNASECIEGTGSLASKQCTDGARLEAAKECSDSTGHPKDMCGASECTEDTGLLVDKECIVVTGPIAAKECTDGTGHDTLGETSECMEGTGLLVDTECTVDTGLVVATECSDCTGPPRGNYTTPQCIEGAGFLANKECIVVTGLATDKECPDNTEHETIERPSDCVDSARQTADKERLETSGLITENCNQEIISNPFLTSPTNSDITPPSQSTLSCRSPKNTSNMHQIATSANPAGENTASGEKSADESSAGESLLAVL